MAGVARAAPPQQPQGPAQLPVPAGLGRYLVLGAVFVCAACGLVYELELVALASYLIGDSVTQASVVLSVMVFAMGIGSLLAKRLRCRPTVGFGLVEAALALVGGTSAMALYGAFVWFGQSSTVLVAFSLAIGVLIGAEVPLLMTLIQRIRVQDAGCAVADLFAADYVGALVGGLAFPFLLLPALGQLSGALLTGAVNAVAGGATVLWLFRRDLTVRARWLLLGVNVLVLGLLAAAAVAVGPFEAAARRAVYGTDVRVAVQTEVQEIVLTGDAGGARVAGGAGGTAGAGRKGDGGPRGRSGGGSGAGGASGGASDGGSDGADGSAGAGGRGSAVVHGRPVPVGAGRPDRRHPRSLSLFLDGRLKVSSRDEARYHEALVHPAMAGGHGRVLVLGGGDGLALREVLRYPGVRAVTVVELDPGVVRVARTDPGLSALNEDAFGDHRVRVVPADAFEWLRRAVRDPHRRPYDVVISDLPDPGITASTKLYSQEFYGLARRVLAPDGRLAVHAGTLSVRPRVFWTVDATLRSVGMRTAPYRVGGRLSGFPGGPDRHSDGVTEPRDWGFVLASRRGGPVRLGLPGRAPGLDSLTPAALRRAGRVAERGRPAGLPASTLMHPRYPG
ncbi:spermidine synthase [Streptomyces sp. NPDC001922]|uniref:spermidine synthase n=1 Tax=Streptomyces sp. NPDC001922 TaxID=3364624 RepID=UPI0036AC2AA1